MADDPLRERAARLAGLMASLDNSVSELSKAIVALSASTKRRVRWLWAAIAVALIALVGVGYAIKATHDQANENLATLRRQCEETNEAGARQVLVWETFTHIGAPSPTPEQQKIIDELLAFVRNTYQPRDCTLPPA